MTAFPDNYAAISSALETYRQRKPDEWQRRFLDSIASRSLQAVASAEDRKLHNFIILTYISSEQRSRNQIGKAIHISLSKPEHIITERKARSRFCALSFGTDGLEWSGDIVDNMTQLLKYYRLFRVYCESPAPEPEGGGKSFESIKQCHAKTANIMRRLDSALAICREKDTRAGRESMSFS